MPQRLQRPFRHVACAKIYIIVSLQYFLKLIQIESYSNWLALRLGVSVRVSISLGFALGLGVCVRVRGSINAGVGVRVA